MPKQSDIIVVTVYKDGKYWGTSGKHPERLDVPLKRSFPDSKSVTITATSPNTWDIHVVTKDD